MGRLCTIGDPRFTALDVRSVRYDHDGAGRSLWRSAMNGGPGMGYSAVDERDATPMAASAMGAVTNGEAIAARGRSHTVYSLVFLVRATVVAVSTFMCALAGILAHWPLAPAVLEQSKSMTGSVVGLVATLLSVVVGLLVSQSYGLFNTHQSDLATLGRSVARIRYLLSPFGPQADAAHVILRKQMRDLKARLWSDKLSSRRSVVYEQVHRDVHLMLVALEQLRAVDVERREAVAQAQELFGKFIETQMSMIRSLSNQVPDLLLNVVMGWACALFFAYGLLAGFNGVTLVMAAIGSVAIASAILLILEMSDPYSGLFRISSASIDPFIL
jgi:hypothetical protein